MASISVIEAETSPYQSLASRLLKPKPQISKGFLAFAGFWYIFYKRIKYQYSVSFSGFYHLCFYELLI